MIRTLARWVLRAIALVTALVLAYIAISIIHVQMHESGDPRLAAPGGRFIDAQGVSVFTQGFGDEHAPPLLLMHGTAAWSGTWFSLIPTLQHAGYRVIAVDLPPFGYSDKRDTLDFSRAAQAGRLLAVLDSYHIDRATVIAHSFGGGPALELALTSPTRVQRLILIDAALGLQAPTPDPDSLACRLLGNRTTRNALIASSASNPLWSGMLLRSFVYRKEAVTPERLVQYQRPASLNGASAALGAWAHHFVCDSETGASTQAAEIRLSSVPMALIWGANDTVTPLPQARHLQELRPDAPLHVIEGVGHIPHIEDPAKLEAILLEVLRNPPAPAASVKPLSAAQR